jgi:signal transduction histidine kinase
LVLTLLLTNLILGPVRRIEQTIDRIVQGNVVEPGMHRGSAKEFRAVENKLSLLGREYRGAREDARQLRNRIDVEVERMASQLDVATRLAAISRLTGGVAHEIKNPLNAILLRLDLLRERLGAPEEELAGEIGILSKEVLRLDRVVKTFLDFSRPLEVRFQDVDLVALAGEVADLMTPQASQYGIVMEFHASEAGGAEAAMVEEPERVGAAAGAFEAHGFAPLAVSASLETRLPPDQAHDPIRGQARGQAWMRGDPDLLKQAILNLVTNAIEVMKTGGRLRIGVGASGNLVALEIADNGPGIPPEVRPKVFQLYFTTKERGSGIGLAMVYRAVQLHNGTIDFESETGRGTSFRLQFPARQAR